MIFSSSGTERTTREAGSALVRVPKAECLLLGMTQIWIRAVFQRQASPASEVSTEGYIQYRDKSRVVDRKNGKFHEDPWHRAVWLGLTARLSSQPTLCVAGCFAWRRTVTERYPIIRVSYRRPASRERCESVASLDRYQTQPKGEISANSCLCYPMRVSWIA